MFTAIDDGNDGLMTAGADGRLLTVTDQDQQMGNGFLTTDLAFQDEGRVLAALGGLDG
jgi:hypothetical protein